MNKRNLGTLLKDVLIVPKLDRRLFSVNSFLNKENNLVNFEKNQIELSMYEGPRIKVPLSSLQSNVLIVVFRNKQKRENYQNSETVKL